LMGWIVNNLKRTLQARVRKSWDLILKIRWKSMIPVPSTLSLISSMRDSPYARKLN
jgi:hypothetical protein